MDGRGWFCVMARWKESLHLLDIQLSRVGATSNKRCICELRCM